MCGSSAYTGNETGIYIDQAFVCRIKDTLYNGRVDMLHKVIQHLTRNKHLLNEAIKYPFLNQVIHLSKNFRPLTDDEQNAAIDTVLSSEVYDRVKDEEMKQDPNYEWIHLDSCENSYDQPYLYNEGWGKKMSYTFAIGPNYIIDVSDKYLSPNRPENHLPRNKCPEVSLKGILAHHNAQSILASSKDTILRTTSQLIADLMNARGKVHPVHTETTSTNEGASLLPRQSGAGAWTRQRGEDNNE
ncbi:Peptide-N(4)-(N-acetyl-beta-glucosaminyl)asparagine amidase [Pichia kudriavzevii]|uniref:Peptide-N(4)-(N-acetyl-beta-glucosaminyl)asparagine amidase n=1 Tax=Pichia kudriavzevii TaxID=4909 RepID=A0A1V2LP79_PICKU|nr:Peptide-N(4)-(N-acetyl-beta-glucosaminyl)asparagine amidase [Pichia kudriavzevii]